MRRNQILVHPTIGSYRECQQKTELGDCRELFRQHSDSVKNWYALSQEVYKTHFKRVFESLRSVSRYLGLCFYFKIHDAEDVLLLQCLHDIVVLVSNVSHTNVMFNIFNSLTFDAFKFVCIPSGFKKNFSD